MTQYDTTIAALGSSYQCVICWNLMKMDDMFSLSDFFGQAVSQVARIMCAAWVDVGKLLQFVTILA